VTYRYLFYQLDALLSSSKYGTILPYGGKMTPYNASSQAASFLGIARLFEQASGYPEALLYQPKIERRNS
jgi:hypothetical protein